MRYVWPLTGAILLIGCGGGNAPVNQPGNPTADPIKQNVIEQMKADEEERGTPIPAKTKK